MKPAQFERRVKNVIDGKENDSGLTEVLSAASKIYGLAMNWRAGLYKKGILQKRRLPCKVIAFGNLTLGGTGKTPMTIFAAKLLQQMGLKTAVVSRGYKGKTESSGTIGIVSDGKQLFMKPDQAGDEPFLIATKLEGVPVLVGKNRYLAGMHAWKKFYPEIIILDDAFQHLALHRNLNILLLDAAKPFGNHSIFPRGSLREPVKQAQRADAVILTRCPGQNCIPPLFSDKIRKMLQEKPLFKTFNRPIGFTTLNKNGQWEVHPLEKFTSKKCVAFCGIVQNQDFKKLFFELGCRITAFLSFADHHKYNRFDIEKILKTAKNSDADILVTTEKDLVKLSDVCFNPYKIYALGIDIFFQNNRNAFDNLILSV